MHRSTRVQRLCRRVPRLYLEFLPAYAPELNPDEGVWRQAKRRLANGCPADRVAFARRVRVALEELRRSPSKLWSCITHSGLTRRCAQLLHYLRSDHLLSGLRARVFSILTLQSRPRKQGHCLTVTSLP